MPFEHPHGDLLDHRPVGDVAGLVLVGVRRLERESPTTCQPSRRSARQSAAPIPDDAPVTTATRILPRQ